MSNSAQLQNFSSQHNRIILLLYLVLSLMLGLALVSVIHIMQRLLPDWHLVYLPLLGLAISWEAFISYRLLQKQQLDLFELKWWIYHISEWVTILITLRFVTVIFNLAQKPLQDLTLQPESILRFFSESQFLFIALVLALIWIQSKYFAKHLDEMIISEEEIGEDQSALVIMSQRENRAHIFDYVLITGGIMIILTVFTRLDIRNFLSSSPALKVSVLNLVAYFVLALVFLTLSDFFTLRERWLVHNVTIDHSVAFRWLRYALVFFGLIGLLAFLLPTSYTLNLLQTLQYVAAAIWGAVNILFAVIVAVIQFILTIINWLISLLGLGGGSVEHSPQIAPIIPTPPPSVETTPTPLFDLFKSIIFWGIFLAIIVFGIDYYLHQHKELWQKVRPAGLLDFLRRLWRSLLSWLVILNRKMSSTVQRGLTMLQLRKSRSTPQRTIHHFRLGRLTPRRQIFFLYDALLQVGKKAGIQRRDSQTPSGYRHRMQSSIPETREDVDVITDNFLEARYSQHTIEQKQADNTRSAFHAIRARLRRILH
jgi:hypothetical protein